MDGKKFEALIKDSCELQGVDATRLHDAGAYVDGVQTGEGRRFTTKNICDFILFDGENMVFLEAKVRKQSLRFDDLTQKEMMTKKLKTAEPVGAKVGFLVMFQPAAVFWLPVQAVNEMQDRTGKKSFNAKDCLSNPDIAKPVFMFKPQGKRNFRLNIVEMIGAI